MAKTKAPDPAKVEAVTTEAEKAEKTDATKKADRGVIVDLQEPRLDPDSPEYDPEGYKTDIANEFAKLSGIAQNIQAAFDNSIVNDIIKSLDVAIKGVRSWKNIFDFGRIKDGLRVLAEIAEARLNEWSIYAEKELLKPEYGGKSLEEIRAEGEDENGKIIPGSLYDKLTAAVAVEMQTAHLLYYEEALQPELQAELSKSKYGGKTIDELRAEYQAIKKAGKLDEYLPDGTLYEQAVTAAENLAEAAEAANIMAGRITTTIKRTDLLEYPLDKVNAEIWRLLESDTGKQIAIGTEKSGSKNELNIYYSIDFEDLQGLTITKKLEPFDKRVYIAVSALFNAGNTVITLTQIHYAMGNSKRPSSNQLQKIYDSVRKMTGARVYVNNEDEAKVYNYPTFKYEGSLLPIESISAVVNGQLTNAAIHLFREPPVVSFAKQRNQLTTVTISLLDSPVSKTNGNLAIDDYLIERISRAKNGKQPCKILYKTLYERANLTTTKQKQRAPETVKRYLEHYKQDGFITGYKQSEDSITVYYADK